MHINLDGFKAKKDSRPVFVWFAGALFVLAGFAVFTRLVLTPVPGASDQAVLREVARFRFSTLNLVLIGLTMLGSTPIIVIEAAVALTWLFKQGDRLSGNQVIAASSGALLWTELIKRIFARPRPTLVPALVHAVGYSYPSGHTFSATATYLTLAIVACRHVSSPARRRNLLTAAVAGIVAVAFSRVYLGVHYASDAVGGILLGTGWTLLVEGSCRTWFNRRQVRLNR